MNNTLPVSARDDLNNREERDFQEVICSVTEYGSIVAETIADVVGDINSIPIVGEMVQVVTGRVAAVSHVTKGGLNMIKTALGCDDMLFEEIKQIMETRFNEVDRKLDQQAEALAKISNMVSKTLETVEKIRIEMNEGFNRVVYAIENIDLKQKVTQVNNVVDYFLTEKNRLKKLPKENYVAKLEEENGLLSHLKESRTPRGDTLHTAIYDIINNDLAVPKNENDLKAVQALYALFYGTQTYVSIFVFLLQANSYLADYYYQNGDYVKFNKQIDTIKTIFTDFKSSILGEDERGLLFKVNRILVQVKSKDFVDKLENIEIYQQVAVRSQTIDKLKTEIKNMKLPIIEDIPPKATIKFKSPDINTPLGGWKSGISVKYAIQYQKNGLYSKLSEWSDKVEIFNKACPSVKIPISTGGKKRLIFRQFNNDKPQLVSVLFGSQTEFRDIDRDLYNAAGMADKDMGLQIATTCIEKGANVKAIFELGRTALHNAAKSGNVRVMKLLLDNGFPNVNIKDRKGYTPIHVAADSGNPGFITEVVKKGGDVNAVTTLNLYTPLHIAAQNGYKTVIEELVQKSGINVSLKDKHGFAPMHYAINGGTEVVSGFYNGNNVDFNVKSDTGLTPAHLAAINKKFAVIEDLKSKPSFNINAVDTNNMTPLHYAAMMGHYNMIKNMINLEGLDLNIAARGNQWTPLHYAIYFDHRGTALELIKSPKIDVNPKASGKVTPLHMAAGLGQLTVVKELLNKDANTEATLPKGYTPVYLALIKDERPVVEELINKGANIKALVVNCLTLVDFAEHFKSRRVIKYLKTKKDGDRTFYAIIKALGTNDCLYNPNTEKLKRNLEYGISSVNKIDIPLKTSILLGNDISFAPMSSLIHSYDSSGSILLLDVLLRKLTKEKYGLTLDATKSEFEAPTRALKITGDFQDILSTLSDVPVDEQIDFSEVYSRVKKTLLSGRGYSLPKILCSYADTVMSLKPEDKEYLITTILPNNPIIRNYDVQASADIASMLKETCAV